MRWGKLVALGTVFAGLQSLAALSLLADDAASPPSAPAAAEEPAASPAPAATGNNSTAAKATGGDATGGDATGAKAAESLTPEKLAVEQAKLAKQYGDLEKIFLLMAEDTARNDPRRAALLRQAFKQSQERAIRSQLEQVSKLLGKDELYQAAKNQQELQADLKKLLELLLSGDRSKQVENEKTLVRQFITRINGLIKEEQGLQNKTTNDGELKDIGDRQDKLTDKAAELANDILQKMGSPADEQADAQRKNVDGKNQTPAPGDKNSPNKKPSDGKSNDGKPSDGKPSEPKPADDKSSPPSKGADDKPGAESPAKPAEGKPADKPGDKPDDKSAEPQKPADAAQPNDKRPSDKRPDDKKPSDEKPSDKPSPDSKPGQSPAGKPREDSQTPPQKSPAGKPGEQNSDPRKPEQQPGDPAEKPPENANDKPSSDTPARKRIMAAEEKMRDAMKKIKDAQRKAAGDEQEKAIQELQIAKAELEAILRQIREEESERVLALLESRFRKMLQMQTEVYESTVSLDKTPTDARDRDTDQQAGKLGRKEAEIVIEADKALSLMRQEGSGVAMPEAVEQMRDDMDQVVARLGKTNIGAVTQGIQKDVLAALEEMIAALQKAQKDQKQKKPQKPQKSDGGGEERDPDLLDQIAELKMVRALQMRINTRHERYSKLVEGEQADKPELLKALDRLSEREEKVHRATREIVQGRNQ